jgi:hypothetical protein
MGLSIGSGLIISVFLLAQAAVDWSDIAGQMGLAAAVFLLIWWGNRRSGVVIP